MSFCNLTHAVVPSVNFGLVFSFSVAFSATSHAYSAQMLPIVTGVTWPVCLLVGHIMSLIKMAQPMEVPFGMWAQMAP